MKQITKRRKILLISTFIISFLVSTSLLWTPQVSYSCDINTFEPISVLKYDDVALANNCSIDEDGNLEIAGGDPHLVYADFSNIGRVIKVNFGEPLSEDTEIELFLNQQWGFNEAQKFEYVCSKGDTSVYFIVGDYNYIQLRLDINIPCNLESVELGTAEIKETNMTDDVFWPLWALVISVLSTLCVNFLDEKKQVADSIAEWLIKIKTNALKMVICLLTIGIVSVVISVLWKGIPALSLYGIYSFLIITAFIFIVLLAIVYLWYSRKRLVNDFEKVFAVLLVLVGLAMILVSPLAHLSWDTETHYRWALEASYLGDTKVTRSDILITTCAADSLIKADPYANFLNMGVLTVGYQDVVSSYQGEISLAHLPSGIFIALGRLLGLPFMFIYMLGKLPNLFIYTALCYFAMKKLKDGKLILAVIALFPTNVFLACNYSYDYWVIGFSILGMAYFIGMLQNKDNVVSVKETAIMCVSFGLACIPKLIYFPLLLIPFFMPQKKLDNKKKYYLSCVMTLLVLVLLFAVEALAQTTGTGDLRGGSTVGPADQIAFVFSDIFNYAEILLNFLFKEYFAFANMKNYISLFAYLGVAEGSIVFIVLLVLAFLFDRNEAYTKETESNWLCRIYVILMFLGGSALVATALYVAYTPVGYGTVLGCQARYMVPWLYPLLSVLSLNRIKPVIPKKVLYWIATIGCFGMLFYDLYAVFLPSVVYM